MKDLGVFLSSEVQVPSFNHALKKKKKTEKGKGVEFVRTSVSYWKHTFSRDISKATGSSDKGMSK